MQEMDGAVITLIATSLCMVRSDPGVWSALSFLGGPPGPPAAGKRSTNELQELYPSPVEDDMDAAGSSLELDYEEYDEEYELEPRIQPYRRRRKPYRRRRKNKPQHSSYWDNKVDVEDNYIDSVSNTDGLEYDNPSSYNPSPSYDDNTRSSYEAPSSYSAPPSSYDAPPPYTGPSGPSYGSRDSFNDFLNALAAFLPIGLFLAAIPPNLIVINSTSRRKRQAEDSIQNSVDSDLIFPSHRPFLERMMALGPQMWSTQCQAMIFCQMAELGGTPEGNTIQKLFSTTTKVTPDFAADMLGIKELFQASREGGCSQFQCHY